MGQKSRVIQIGAGIGILLWAIALFLPAQSRAEMLSLGAIGERLAASSNVAADGSGMTQDIPTQRGWLATAGRTSERDEEDCLARNIYWEGGGEPFEGKVAIAAVTLNRVEDERYPKTICGVVQQRSGICQFSWMCTGRKNRMPRGIAWEEAKDVANILLHIDWFDPTGGALYFHADYVRPSWSQTMSRIGQIGRHIFYRDRWTAAAGAGHSPS